MRSEIITAIEAEVKAFRAFLTPAQVMASVCAVTGVEESRMVDRWRKRREVDARRCYVWFARQLPSQTFAVIGNAMNRDHSTAIVLHQTMLDLLRFENDWMLHIIPQIWDHIKEAIGEKIQSEAAA